MTMYISDVDSMSLYLHGCLQTYIYIFLSAPRQCTNLDYYLVVLLILIVLDRDQQISNNFNTMVTLLLQVQVLLSL